MTEEQYWYGNPYLLLNYAEKYKDQVKMNEYYSWLTATYVKSALTSTILIAGLADKNTQSKMPKYAECPLQIDAEVEMSEERIEYEKMRLINYLNNIKPVE